MALLWTRHADEFAVWENEFFNRSVGDVYTTGPAVPGGLAQTPVVDRPAAPASARARRKPRARRRTCSPTHRSSSEAPWSARTRVKRWSSTGVDGPLRQLAFVDGLYPQDTWSGKHVTYTRLDCRGGSLAVELQSDPALFTKPNDRGRSRRRRGVVGRVRSTRPGRRALRVPLEPDGGKCIVALHRRRTAVPAVVTDGENPDPRELGIHFTRFDYEP